MAPHDPNNPLSVIVAIGERLRRVLPAAGARDLQRPASTILRAARHMDEIIRALLDLAQLDAGRLALDVADEPVEALLRESADVLLPLAEEREARLITTIEAGPPLVVRGDRARVLRILSNL